MGNDSIVIKTVLDRLSTVFRIRDLGKPRFSLGIEAVDGAGTIVLSQRQYITELLRREGMESCKPLATPASPSTQAASHDSNALEDPTPYRQLVGSLMYLLITRPDLAYSVNRLCQFMHNPTQGHWDALNRVLRYVKGSLDIGLRITPSTAPVLHAFSDSDWAGCSVDRKSTGGYAVFLGPNLLSWVSRKQRMVARSSTEA
ncbi:PREDICTED: uncharacterized protein LOC109147086 [Ipomoea nil]|uniref:uncharacterized protein LOC109147086 n=1 Tax=Ipomoea nil TaxID=35883 RepID=UPI00090085C5|nr:PREDICTED: uncharacterized protein LOC109147086 [Ipomoea nil]